MRELGLKGCLKLSMPLTFILENSVYMSDNEAVQMDVVRLSKVGRSLRCSCVVKAAYNGLCGGQDEHILL